MKKIIKILLIIALLTVCKAEAVSFKPKEIIPAKSLVTVIGDKFKYIGMHLSEDKIVFQSVENISEEALPLSVSISLFDKNEKNIGTIYSCNQDEILLPQEKKEYTVSIENALAPKKELKDIHYFAVISDNTNCYNETSQEYLGEKIEEMGKTKGSILTDDVSILIKVMLGVGAFLICIFLYKFLFTGDYQNMDGEDVRKDYKKWQKQKMEELRKNPPPKEERPVKKNKTDEVIQQEKEASSEDKNGTELHNLYK